MHDSYACIIRFHYLRTESYKVLNIRIISVQRLLIFNFLSFRMIKTIQNSFCRIFSWNPKIPNKNDKFKLQNDLQTFYICIHIQNILLKVNVMSKLKHTSLRREYVSMKNEQRTYTCDVIPTIV